MIQELATRLLAPRMNEFEHLWATANAMCDRYGIGCSEVLVLGKAA